MTSETDVVVTQKCANCDTPLHGKFCAKCGQNSFYERLSFRHVGQFIAETFGGFDAGYWKTFKAMTTRPGEMCSEFVEGRHKSYMNPLKYYLISIAGYLFFFNWFPINMDAWMETVATDPEARAATEQYMQLMFDNFKWTALITAIPLPFILRLFFRKSGRTVLDNAILVLYINAHGTVFSILLHFLMMAGWMNLGMTLALLFGAVYLAWAGVKFYGEGWVRTTLKAFIASTISFLFFMFAVAIWIGITIASKAG